jgi:hypothetical protein
MSSAGHSSSRVPIGDVGGGSSMSMPPMSLADSSASPPEDSDAAPSGDILTSSYGVNHRSPPLRMLVDGRSYATPVRRRSISANNSGSGGLGGSAVCTHRDHRAASASLIAPNLRIHPLPARSARGSAQSSAANSAAASTAPSPSGSPTASVSSSPTGSPRQPQPRRLPPAVQLTVPHARLHGSTATGVAPSLAASTPADVLASPSLVLDPDPQATPN